MAREARFMKGVAGPTGLEPATSGLTGRRSNRLNYDPARDARGCSACDFRNGLRSRTTNGQPAKPYHIPTARTLQQSVSACADARNCDRSRRDRRRPDSASRRPLSRAGRKYNPLCILFGRQNVPAGPCEADSAASECRRVGLQACIIANLSPRRRSPPAVNRNARALIERSRRPRSTPAFQPAAKKFQKND